jgi:hypothetical protein
MSVYFDVPRQSNYVGSPTWVSVTEDGAGIGGCEVCRMRWYGPGDQCHQVHAEHTHSIVSVAEHFVATGQVVDYPSAREMVDRLLTHLYDMTQPFNFDPEADEADEHQQEAGGPHRPAVQRIAQRWIR